MRFSPERKKEIIIYLLEKIEKQDESLTKHVSEVQGVNQSTIHSYIKELLDQDIIRRVKRGQYELVQQEFTFQLARKNGDLDNDTYAFTQCLKPHIQNLSNNIQEIWAYVFSEMINNVMDHSGAENLEIQIIQDFLHTTVVIVDDGVGIFTKIKDFFNLDSLDEAICELFKGKLTTDSQNHSGEGIFFSSKLMDKFFIVSSQRIFTNNIFDDEKILNFSENPFPGTCVIMELSNFSHKESHQIFDHFANIDGGFTKTTIPLKNIFDSSPVSRSQAKRICSRLDKFEEVILDFEGIDWMGQGFAHQIFVIFKRNHPSIKLTPVKMNETVEKMYYHVLQTDN